VRRLLRLLLLRIIAAAAAALLLLLLLAVLPPPPPPVMISAYITLRRNPLPTGYSMPLSSLTAAAAALGVE
jgi:hypothetical protein